MQLPLETRRWPSAEKKESKKRENISSIFSSVHFEPFSVSLEYAWKGGASLLTNSENANGGWDTGTEATEAAEAAEALAEEEGAKTAERAENEGAGAGDSHEDRSARKREAATSRESTETIKRKKKETAKGEFMP